MKRFLIFFLFVFALAQAGELSNSNSFKEVAKCEVNGKPKKTVRFIKQWHLSSTIDSHDVQKSKSFPQSENQKAIYEELNRWVESGEMPELFAEGCSYPQEITKKSTERFNGWSMQDLASQASSPEYADIVTNVAYKLEAKWGERLHTVCGDDASAIRKNQLAFSDARGALGFLTRLTQYKGDPRRAKPYLEGVVELYHLPKTTTVDQAIRRLNLELRKSIVAIRDWIGARNKTLVNAILASHADQIAVVFGGAHAEGVRKLLEKADVGCTIYEARGYQGNEEELSAKLQQLIR